MIHEVNSVKCFLFNALSLFISILLHGFWSCYYFGPLAFYKLQLFPCCLPDSAMEASLPAHLMSKMRRHYDCKELEEIAKWKIILA